MSLAGQTRIIINSCHNMMQCDVPSINLLQEESQSYRERGPF